MDDKNAAQRQPVENFAEPVRVTPQKVTPQKVAQSGTDPQRPTESGSQRRTLDFETDLTDRTNRELRRLGWPGPKLSTQDIQEIRDQQAGRPLAKDVVGLSNQLAQIAITGDIVRLRGGVEHPDASHASIPFARKQKDNLSAEQRQQIAGIAARSVELLRRNLPEHRLVVRVTGYGNGEFSLLDRERTDRTAVATSQQRANLVARDLQIGLTREVTSHLGAQDWLHDVRFEQQYAGRGGPDETDASRRRVDVDVWLERRPDGHLRFVEPADLRGVDVPDRAQAMPNDVGDPTLPMRTVLDQLATRYPPDRSPTDPRPRLRLDDILSREQRWLAYISPDDHAKAQRTNPLGPGSSYENNFEAAMRPAVDTYLQGDGIDVSQLDWRAYRRLHRDVTHQVVGSNFAPSGRGTSAFAIRTPVPAADILHERIGGRPLIAAESDGTGQPLTTWARDDARRHTVITTRYDVNDAPGLVNEIFHQFRTEIAAADDDHARLIAIARTVRALHVLHLHRDGNGRLNVFILLPRLLMEYGFHPMYLDGGDRMRRAVLHSVGALFNGGYTLEQIATAIRFLQPGDTRFDRTYGADAPAPHSRRPAADSDNTAFGTPVGHEATGHEPAGREPVRPDSRKRPAEQDEDAEQVKRPRVLEVLPGSAQDAVFSALHDVRRDAAGRQNTPPSRPWTFARPGQGPALAPGPTRPAGSAGSATGPAGLEPGPPAGPATGSSQPRVLTRDTFPEHSLEPIRYLREHHPDLIGLNAVHYHAAHPDYLVNCVNVAVSVAETLNGNRHIPLPATGPRRGSLIERHFGRPVRPLANPDGIVAELLAAGPGGHGIVFDIGPNGDGHVFTALHDTRTNDIVLLDAQSGRLAAVRADHTYGFLLTSGPTGDTPASAPTSDIPAHTTFSHHDFGAPNTLPAALTVDAQPTEEQQQQIRALAAQASTAALDRLPNERVVIAVTGHGAIGLFQALPVQQRINSELRNQFDAWQHRTPRELDVDEDVRVVARRAGGQPRIEITVSTEPHPSAPPAPTFPPSGPFRSDPTAGTRQLLDTLANEYPPDHTERQPRDPILLDQVLWPSQHWLAYISPDNHQEAVSTHPDNPGGMYRDNFQQPMDATVRKVLRNGEVDGRLTWDSYKSLHQDVVNGAQGTFGRTRSTHHAGFSLRTPDPAPDILTERLGGRPLMSHDSADHPLIRWQWSANHNSAIAETQYGAGETGALVDEVFDRMYSELADASSDHDRMVAIARAVRALHVLHPYLDGNGRLNVFILLPHLLMRHGFRPMYIGETEQQREILLAMGALFNGGYTVDQIATAIRMLQPDETDDEPPDDDSDGIQIGDEQYSDE